MSFCHVKETVYVHCANSINYHKMQVQNRAMVKLEIVSGDFLFFLYTMCFLTQ